MHLLSQVRKRDCNVQLIRDASILADVSLVILDLPCIQWMCCIQRNIYLPPYVAVQMQPSLPQ